MWGLSPKEQAECEKTGMVLGLFARKYFLSTAYEIQLYEKIDNLALSGENFDDRVDFLTEYLNVILPKELQMLGNYKESKEIITKRWDDISRLKEHFETEGTRNCLKIPIKDAFDMIYVIPIYIVSKPNINSLWYCPKDLCLYTHHLRKPSQQEKDSVMNQLSKHSITNHQVLWRRRNHKEPIATVSETPNCSETENKKNTLVSDKDTEEMEPIPKTISSENCFVLDIFQCPECHEYYDLLERYPMTLVPCGHSVCAQCIAETETCPNCHSLIGFSIITIALLSTMRIIQEEGMATSETKEMGLMTPIKEDRATSPMEGLLNGFENSEPPEDESKKETEIKTEPKKQKLVDKSKLVIRGLRNGITIDEIIKELFQSPKGLLYYDTRPDISLRVEEESLSCRANFINREEATKAWFQCRCSIKDLHLTGTNVDYLEIGEEVQGIDGKEAGSSELSPEILLEKHVTLDRRSLFISGLPLRFSEDDVIEIIFQGKTHLDYSREGKPIILVSTGQAQNCVAHLIDEYVTQQCMMKWDTCLMENDRRLIVTYLGLASRELSKNYAKLEERRKSDKKSMEQEYDDTQKFLNDSIKYEKKLLISGFPNSFSRFDVMRALLSDGFEENAYANVYLKPMGVFQNALLYFKEESVAKELQKRWRGKSFGGGMQIMLRLLDIDDSEIYHEETIKGRLVDLGLHRSNLPHRPLPHVAPQKRFRDVRFPRERNPFKLFISGIPPSLHFWDIIEEILGGEEEIATNEGRLAILIGDTLDGPKNCAVRFHTRRAAEMVLNRTRNRVINKEYRLFAEYFGDAQRNFVYNYGTRI